MEISNTIGNAYSGLQLQQERLDRNVAEITSTEASAGRDASTQDRALVEQSEIVAGFQSNARSLQAAGERIGTLLDVRA